MGSQYDHIDPAIEQQLTKLLEEVDRELAHYQKVMMLASQPLERLKTLAEVAEDLGITAEDLEAVGDVEIEDGDDEGAVPKVICDDQGTAPSMFCLCINKRSLPLLQWKYQPPM